MPDDLLRRYKKELEGLTVGGSEYYDEPERCARDIRERLDSQQEFIERLIMQRKGDNTMIDIKDYPVSISGSEKEGYIATIKLLNCIGDGDTIPEAIEDVRRVGEAFLKIAMADGIKIPEPNMQ